MTILEQPIPKNPPTLARIFFFKNYFEAVGIFFSIKEEFLVMGNLNFSKGLRDKRR